MFGCHGFHVFPDKITSLTHLSFGAGLPAVITMSFYQNIVDGKLLTFDGVEMCSTFQRLEEAGADVLGLNCARGPATTVPLLKEIKKVLKVNDRYS